ncbi:hypothetical protein BX070DRAFT_76596 [Coemansia spiralis]|nr:hypothetical protein BX070DRAFT_76596 [Coemansia spiralis]
MLCKPVVRCGFGNCSLTSGVWQRPSGSWHGSSATASSVVIRSLSTEKPDVSKVAVASSDIQQKQSSRQRIPVDDLDDTPTTCTGSSLTTAAMRCLPLPARRHIAHTLNLRIARAALGQHAIDDLCEGATAALPQIARLLTAASAGDAGASDDLSHIFTAPLLARYRTDLGRLRNDNVHLDLQVRRVNSAQIHQLRTQTGPLEAHNAMDACKRQQQQHQLSSHLDGQQLAGDHMSVLRAGLARQKYQYTSMLGASYAVGAHASPSSQPQAQARSWAAGIWAAASGKAPVRVRVDVELNADMRYQLIGEHKSPTEYDRHRGTSKVIVDDDATRNLILTLESTTAVTSDNTDMQNYGEQPNKEFQWRVADIDYLLSSEQRIQQELKKHGVSSNMKSTYVIPFHRKQHLQIFNQHSHLPHCKSECAQGISALRVNTSSHKELRSFIFVSFFIFHFLSFGYLWYVLFAQLSKWSIFVSCVEGVFSYSSLVNSN